MNDLTISLLTYSDLVVEYYLTKSSHKNGQRLLAQGENQSRTVGGEKGGQSER